MSLNNPRIEIATAYPNLKKISLGKGKGVTLFGDIHTDQGARLAYVKLLSLEGIAREAICSVLGRLLHLPVRQGYFVSMVNTQFHSQTGNVESLAFGTLYDFTRLFRLTELSGFEMELLKWPDLLKSAVFDEWIANGDRLPNNMAFERGNLFWLFDHDEAFPGHISKGTPVGSQLLALFARDKAEIELHRIRNQALEIVKSYEQIEWDGVYNYVRAKEFKILEKYFLKQISFLKNRVAEMRNILTQDLGIKQIDFFSSDIQKKPKESKS